MSILKGIKHVHQIRRSTVLWLCRRLRDEHTVRTKAESELEGIQEQAAAYKEKLQEATAGQAQAARLAADLEVEQTLHKEAKSHIGTLESRYTVHVTVHSICIARQAVDTESPQLRNQTEKPTADFSADNDLLLYDAAVCSLYLRLRWLVPSVLCNCLCPGPTQQPKPRISALAAARQCALCVTMIQHHTV